MTKHKLDLFARHPGKPFQEFIDPGVAFDILEQGSYWDAAVFE
ncbi:MAG: hypothetical protein WBE57_16115 [Xanthobacteraceae bacterium]